jgi:arabinofuranosyltransferase
MLPKPSLRDASVLVALMAGSLAHALHFRHLADDSYISFRYAANLAEGNGLVFNPGEFVMGYSNLLWVLLLSGSEWSGISSPVAAPIWGTLCGWGVLVLVYLELRSRYEGMLPALAGAGLLAVNGTFALWLVGGLEGPLFALLLLAAVLVALHVDAETTRARFAGLGALLGLAALTRPEGIFYAVPVALVLVARRPDRARLRGVALSLGIALLLYAASVLWVVDYYGDPLPNPFYTKYHPLSFEIVVRGLDIARWFLRAYWGVPVVVLAVWAAATRGRLDSPGWLPLLMVAAFVVFFLRVGGDGQAYYRMWFWVLPMLGLLLGEGLGILLASRERILQLWSVGLVAMIATACLQHSLYGPEIKRVRNDEREGRDMILLASELARQHPGSTVAANNIGMLAYYSRLTILDMLGLTDRHIAKAPDKALGFPAHESHDGAYVLDRRPDIILYGIARAYPQPETRERLLEVAYPSDADLREDPRFQRDYVFEQLRLPDGRFVGIFRRSEASGAEGGESVPGDASE